MSFQCLFEFFSACLKSNIINKILLFCFYQIHPRFFLKKLFGYQKCNPNNHWLLFGKVREEIHYLAIMFVSTVTANTLLGFRLLVAMSTDALHSKQLIRVCCFDNEFLSMPVQILSLTLLLFVMVDAYILTIVNGFDLKAIFSFILSEDILVTY